MVTITEYYVSGDIYKLDDEILLSMWESLSNEATRQKREMGIIEMVLQRRMQANNAKKLLSTTLTVGLGPPLYDFAQLWLLGEHVPEEIFREGLVSAHTETVEQYVAAKADMRKVNSWKSYGQHIADIIDAAEIPETRRISIKRKKQEGLDAKDKE
jgi:hypothetical protein